MKPALSVMVFTVLSGAGLGALAIVALFDLAFSIGAIEPIAPAAVVSLAAIVGLILVIAGLCASVIHLANPKNAWRAASRWRTSWLSREAIVASSVIIVAALYVVAIRGEAHPVWRSLLALATIVLASATLYCTAMIYASLKPIRQWYTPRVPLNYLLLGYASGALVAVAVVRGHEIAPTPLAAVALAAFVLAALAKLDYWRFLHDPSGSLTIEQAIGVQHGVAPQPVPGRAPAPRRSVMSARLLDAGHSRHTFLTDEFVYTERSRIRTVLQAAMWIAGVLVPVLWLLFGLARWEGGVLACVACMIGLLAERWLFFADARHTVRLYHGDRRT